MLQSFDLPLADFVGINPDLDPRSLSAVRLVFDRAVAGEVLVDDIGISRLGEDFWRSRVN